MAQGGSMAGQCRASRRSPGRDTSPKAVETYGKEHLRSSIWEGWEHKRAGSGGCRDILRILLAHTSNWAQCSSASGRILRKETGVDPGSQRCAKIPRPGATRLWPLYG